jgi:hypothetical protein
MVDRKARKKANRVFENQMYALPLSAKIHFFGPVL